MHVLGVTTNYIILRGDILDVTNEELNYSLCRFIHEVRKKNGDNYPAETLYDIVICLQLYMAMYGREVRLIEDEDFIQVCNTLDNRMKELSRCGIIAPRKHAEEITIDHEIEMWLKGILGTSDPKTLVSTLLYMFSIHFALRAGAEHRNLRIGSTSQIQELFDGQLGLKYLFYREDMSKNRQGGIDHRKIVRKQVRAYENLDEPERCIVKIYQKYLSVRPKGEKCSNAMYLRPLAKTTSDGIWFSMQPMGRHKLSTVVAELLAKIGITGKISNHSLRASAASRLYQNKVDEQLIMETTGHRSNAVRSYKRTSNGQMRDVSKVLYGNSDGNPPEMPPPKRMCTRSSDCKLNQNLEEEVAVNVNDNSNNSVGNSRQMVVNVNLNFAK